MNLQTLLNKPVRTADGLDLGRIYDFRARREGNEILVTHIRVGAAAWIARLRMTGWLRRLFSSAKEFDLPWEAIATVGDQVQLGSGWDMVRCEECAVGAGTA